MTVGKELPSIDPQIYSIVKEFGLPRVKVNKFPLPFLIVYSKFKQIIVEVNVFLGLHMRCKYTHQVQTPPI